MDDIIHHRIVIIFLNSLLLLSITSCSKEKLHKNAVYVNVYGDFKTDTRLKFDGNIIYEKKKISNKVVELNEIKGPFHFDKDTIKIYFSIDDKDTSLLFPLKRTNYISIGYSNMRHEFQFSLPDSTQFFMPKI